MDPAEKPPPEDVTDEARRLFAEFLKRRQAGEAIEIDSICSSRPDLRPQLRELHFQFQRAALGGEQGSETDLNVEATPDPDQPVQARLEELHARMPSKSRYELRGEVARGGMGVILKVWDNDLRRTLAMKLILLKDKDPGAGSASSSADRELLARFLEEAQITGQLDHPGVVPVHELGVDSGGKVYFTMRMVKGRNLKKIFELARKGEDGWNRTRALGVILKVCEALAYAHSKKVIHRDIKPQNVMVGKFGETYVMDWGLAKVMDHPDRHDLRPRPDFAASMSRLHTDRAEEAARSPDSPLVTMDGTVVGTPSYMPPEQAQGRLDELGPRSDVYSVGALIYTLLTGQVPYIPPGAQISPYTVLNLLIAGPPTPVYQIDRAVPAELIALCEKAMARDPKDRYADMSAMADDLRAFLERRVVRAYETGAVAEFRKWVARNKGTAAALAGLVLLILGASTLFAWQQRRQLRELRRAQVQIEEARLLAERNEHLARDSEQAAITSEREARRKSYVANVLAADASLRVFEAQEARRSLELCDATLRGWEWGHLKLRSDVSENTLTGHTGKVTCVAYSPDGQRIASGSEDHTVILWNAATCERLFLLPGSTEAVRALAFSADGSHIAAASADELVRVWDSMSSRLVATVIGHEGAVTSLAFSPDGRRLVTGSTDQTARVWDASTGQPVGKPLEHEHAVNSVTFDPLGKMISTGADDAVRLWDANASTLLRQLDTEGHESYTVAFSPDGSRIASGGADRMIRIWDVQSGNGLSPFVGHTDLIYSIAFEHDGPRLVSGSFDRSVRVWDAATGAGISVLLGHADQVRCVAFAPGGEYVASGSNDGTVRLWRPDGGKAVQSFRAGERWSAVAFAPDGKRLVAGSLGRGTMLAFDLLSNHALPDPPRVQGGITSMAYSSDGAWILTGGEEDSTMRLWHAATGKLERSFVGHQAPVTAVAFLADGTGVVSGSADNSVRVWSLGSDEPPRLLGGLDQRVTSVAVSSDGRFIACGAFDAKIHLWDARSGATYSTLETNASPVQTIAFDRTGARLASGSADGTIRLWDLAGAGEPRSLSGHSDLVLSVAFSPDGKRLASAGQDKTVRLWNTETGDLLLTLRGHAHWVTSVAFSPDGRSLATASIDGTVKIWMSIEDVSVIR